MKIALLRQFAAAVLASPRRCLVGGLCLGALPWLVGCGAAGAPTQATRGPAPVMLGKVDPIDKKDKPATAPATHVGVVQALHEQELPTPTPVAPACDGKVLPINLDTVLRLAEEQNPQLALGRERVYQATVDHEAADRIWLPDLYAGVAWRRHEGGIQNEDGTLTQSSFGSLFGGAEISGSFDIRETTYRKVIAERELWQKRGELTKTTHDQLLEAASAYIDLLTARNAEAFAREMRAKVDGLYKNARDLAEDVPAARSLADSFNASVRTHDQAILKFKHQGDAASAKLAYLLGLDMHTVLVPVDDHLVTIDLVDASLPTEALVDKAVESGPGIEEIEGLLATIQNALDRAQGPSKWMPIFDVYMQEGGFGAGPGIGMNFANRWELGLAARWNLTEYLTAKERAHSAMSRMRQAQLTLEDLKARMTLGVREAHDAIISGQAQIQNAYEAVQAAGQAYKKAEQRFRDKPPGTNPGDLLQAVFAPINSYELALATWLQAMNEYDKAELRLRLLVGPGGDRAPCVETPGVTQGLSSAAVGAGSKRSSSAPLEANKVPLSTQK